MESAVLDNNIDAVQAMLEKNGVDVNAGNDKGETPLHVASKLKDRQKVIDLLLAQEKVDLEAKDHSGSTPLVNACYYKNLEAAKSLLSHGANPNVDSRRGSPLQICIKKCTSILGALLGTNKIPKDAKCLNDEKKLVQPLSVMTNNNQVVTELLENYFIPLPPDTGMILPFSFSTFFMNEMVAYSQSL